MIRDDIKAATIAAMKGGDKETTSTCASLGGDQEPRHRVAHGGAPKDDDALVTEVLQKMIKQRRESADLYKKAAARTAPSPKKREIAVIERFLPQAA